MTKRFFSLSIAVLFGVSFCSASLLADKGSESKRNTLSRIYTICTTKVPKLAKIGAEGIVAAYAFHLAVVTLLETADWSRFYALHPCMNLVLRNGCIIAGLSMLAHKIGNLCLDDLEKL